MKIYVENKSKIFDLLFNKSNINNFFHTFYSKGITILVPIIVYPMISNTINISQYGKFIYILVISNFFAFIVKFGFDIHLARKISLTSNVLKKSIYIINTLFSKVFLSIFSVIIFLLMNFYVFSIEDEFILYVILYIFSEIFYCNYYFVGCSNLKFVSIINASNKLLFSGLIYLNYTNLNINSVLFNFVLSNFLCSVSSFFLMYVNNKKIIFRVSFKFVILNIKNFIQIR